MMTLTPGMTLAGSGTGHTVAVQFRWGARWVAECQHCPWYRMHITTRTEAMDVADTHTDTSQLAYTDRQHTTVRSTP